MYRVLDCWGLGFWILVFGVSDFRGFGFGVVGVLGLWTQLVGLPSVFQSYG